MPGVYRFYPAILSGGTGTRLWPLSRAALPKQLLALAGTRTMIQDTVLRVNIEGAAAPLLICNDEHRFLVAEQMREIAVKPAAIVLEPVGRNTAPAAAIAALKVAERQSDGIVLLVPSDHVVRDEAAFARALDTAADVAAKGHIATFGIKPSKPETGYGYIEMGGAIAQGAYAVARFTEKPDAATAQSWIDGGRHLWNSGMFVFRADAMIAELEQHAPEVLKAARAALAKAKTDLDFVRLDKDAFAQAPAISIDYAVMERTTRAAVVPAAFGWSDVGSWAALWDLAAQDEAGNALSGDVLMEDSRGCFVRAEKGVAALVGVEDLVIVVTGDAVLVAHRERAQDVKAIVEKLKARGGSEHLNHPKVFRPWGSFEGIDKGDRYQVKQIVVKPGERLSLQMHHHRAEHWVVVEGAALVTRNEETFTLNENESVFIPRGAKHRLENAGDTPLRLIEVQSGEYLGEDDIVRFEDAYGRASGPR